MFKINEIEFEDVFIFKGHYSVKLPLKGLILIEGRNCDAGGSNGAGKTSFLNLIPTALFEANGSNLVKDLIINKSSKKAFIRVRVNDVYDIVYARGGKNEWYVLENGMKVEGKALTDTKRIIEKILRLTYDQYSSSIHLKQGATIGFWHLSPSERVRMISEILNLIIFEQASAKARERANSFDAEISAKQKEVEILEREIKGLKEEISTREAMLIDISVLRDYSAELSQKIEKERKELNGLLEQLGRAKLEAEQFVKEKQDIEKQIAEKEVFIERENRNLESIESTIREVMALSKEYETLKEGKVEKEFLTVLLQKATAEKGSLQTEIGRLNARLDEIVKILSLKAEDECPVCGRELTAEILNKKRSELEAERSEILRRREEASLRISELEKEIAQTNRKIYEAGRVEERIKSIEYFLNKSDVRMLEKSKEEIQKLVKSAHEELKVLKQKSEALGSSEVLNQRFWEIKNKVRDKEIEVSRLEKEFLKVNEQISEQESHRRRIEEIKDGLKRKEGELMQRKRELEELKNEREYYGWWVDGFRRFQLLEIARAIEILQNKVLEYASLLFEGRVNISVDVLRQKKTAKDKFDFKNELYVTLGDGTIPLEGYSGGEKQLIALIFLLALNDVLESNVILLDEVFGSLDEVNRERVARLLKEVSQRKLVMVITHIDEIKSLIDWDGKILIERRGGVSSLVA